MNRYRIVTMLVSTICLLLIRCQNAVPALQAISQQQAFDQLLVAALANQSAYNQANPSGSNGGMFLLAPVAAGASFPVSGISIPRYFNQQQVRSCALLILACPVSPQAEILTCAGACHLKSSQFTKP